MNNIDDVNNPLKSLLFVLECLLTVTVVDLWILGQVWWWSYEVQTYYLEVEWRDASQDPCNQFGQSLPQISAPTHLQNIRSRIKTRHAEFSKSYMQTDILMLIKLRSVKTLLPLEKQGVISRIRSRRLYVRRLVTWGFLNSICLSSW